MYDKLMKYTAVIGTLFTIIAMSVMLYVAINAPIVIEETEDTAAQPPRKQVMGNQMTKELILEQDSNQPIYLCIPLADTTTDDKLKLEANYVEQQLCITIQNQEEDFYSYNRVFGNVSAVNKILWNHEKDATQLLIQLKGVYEHNAFSKNNMLYLEFEKPRESYDKIVVLDAGNEKAQITTEVLNKLRARLSQSQTDLKVYCTGIDSADSTPEKKVAFANELKADMFISIQVTDEKESLEQQGIETIYNPTFFIPGLNSITLSDTLEQNVCRKTGALAGGMIEGRKEDVLVSTATVPASIIRIGNYSNRNDRELLEDDAYVEKIAEGIYQGIKEAYTYKEKGNHHK